MRISFHQEGGGDGAGADLGSWYRQAGVSKPVIRAQILHRCEKQDSKVKLTALLENKKFPELLDAILHTTALKSLLVGEVDVTFGEVDVTFAIQKSAF